jgi:hypothetical protein
VKRLNRFPYRHVDDDPVVFIGAHIAATGREDERTVESQIDAEEESLHDADQDGRYSQYLCAP